MYVPIGASPDPVVSAVEPALHRRTSLEFMPCEYFGTLQRQRQLQQQQQPSLEFTSLSSSPTDVVSSTTVCQVADFRNGQDCYVVESGFTPTYVTDGSNDFVVGAVGDFLNGTMARGELNNSSPELLGLSFRGFTQVPVDNEATPDQEDRGGGDDNSGNVAGAAEQGGVDNSRDFMIGGVAAISVAAVAVLLVAILLVKKRRTEKVYLKHFDDDSIFSIGGPGTNESSDPPKDNADLPIEERAIILQDAEMEEEDWSMTELGVEALHDGTMGWRGEIKTERPTFIRAEVEAQIQEDLGPKRTSPSRSYYSPNTVDL